MQYTEVVHCFIPLNFTSVLYMLEPFGGWLTDQQEHEWLTDPLYHILSTLPTIAKRRGRGPVPQKSIIHTDNMWTTPKQMHPPNISAYQAKFGGQWYRKQMSGPT